MWKFTGSQRPSFAVPPKNGQESVWDYPRPPACVPDTRQVLIRHRETIIADSTRAVRILETASPPTFYIPADDVVRPFLVPSPDQSFCEWKGIASYWHVHLPQHDLQIANCAWSYESPSPQFQSIAGYFAFYPGRIDCFVDGEQVRPQQGNFYGGWVTKEIVGPFKGEAGTRGW